MSHVSIEYSHIYTDNQAMVGHEPVALLSEFLANRPTGSTSSLVVLIDDYSFPDKSFNYQDFSNWLKLNGFKLDLMIRETELIAACNRVVTHITNNTLRRQIKNSIKSGTYPYPLFIATWYLVRLGKIEAESFPVRLVGDELLNILPESFKPFEDKALETIAATKFKDSVDSIGYNFIEGRVIG